MNEGQSVDSGASLGGRELDQQEGKDPVQDPSESVWALRAARRLTARWLMRDSNGV